MTELSEVEDKAVPGRIRASAPVVSFTRVFGWLFTTIRGVILCAVTATMLLVAMTHTVGWAFALTNAILRTGLKVTSISAQATKDVSELRARNQKLDGDLAKAHSDHATTQRRLSSATAKAASLDGDLKRTQGALVDTKALLTTNRADLKRMNAELIDARKPRRVMFKGQSTSVQAATQATIGSLRRRTQQTAATNAASVFGESIPFYGIAVIVAATSFEIGMACQDMNDLYELQIALDPDSRISEDRDEVCGLQVPTRDEIWAKIKSSPGAIWEETKQALAASGAAISNLPAPDFSGVWQSTLGLWDGATGWLGSWWE